MSHGNELPKVIDKSQADIDAAIAAIKASEIESGTKDFAISCIKLAVWLSKALLEHKIKLSNLRKLIFGLGRKNKKKMKETEQSNTTDDVKNNNDDMTTLSSLESIKTETLTPEASNEIAKSKSGHGRLPHSAYINITEHQLSHAEYKAGDLCPMLCGGKLYCIDPGVIVRIKGAKISLLYTNTGLISYAVHRVVIFLLRIFLIMLELKNMMLHLKRFWCYKNITSQFLLTDKHTFNPYLVCHYQHQHNGSSLKKWVVRHSMFFQY
jgi:hypothetical protein